LHDDSDFIGVLSLFASTIVPADVAAEAGIPELTLRLLLLIQPTVLVVGAVIGGVTLAAINWITIQKRNPHPSNTQFTTAC